MASTEEHNNFFFFFFFFFYISNHIKSHQWLDRQWDAMITNFLLSIRIGFPSTID